MQKVRHGVMVVKKSAYLQQIKFTKANIAGKLNYWLIFK
jgi:hypothetical protein